jgi:hypothetical protein
MKKVVPFNEWDTEKTTEPLHENINENTYDISIQEEPEGIVKALKNLGASIKKVFDFGIIRVDIEEDQLNDVKKVAGVDRVEKTKPKE